VRSRRKRVVLTNDDGLGAEGLAELARVLGTFAEVLVVAPREEKSGIGHAVTLRGVVRAREVRFDGALEAYAVEGTPADCAKLAIRALFAREPPRLVVSGLNRGPNVGVNVFYSGTVAAALEAAINGVPAVAVSKEHGEKLSFREAAEAVAPLLRRVLEKGLPRAHALNVNVPDLPADELGGFRLARVGLSGFDESYRELSPSGRRGRTRRFILEGVMRFRDGGGPTDAEVLRAGWIAVTPMELDLTSRGLRLADPRPRARCRWAELLQ